MVKMSKNSILILIIFVTVSTFAQNDTISKENTNRFSDYSNAFHINAKLIEKNIERVDEKEETEDISYLFYNKTDQLNLSYTFNPKKYLDPTNEKKHNFMTGPKPLDSDVMVIKHYDGKNVSQTNLKTSQNLGTIESNTKFIRIEYKDFGLVDGDRVKVFLNEKEIESNVHLDGLFYTIHINLKDKGYNRIDIQAINQGLVGPNTAEFIVYDDKGNVIAHKAWNLQKGSIATLGIVKH